MSRKVPSVFFLCAIVLFALAVPSFAIQCEVFLIPPEYHSGSGYTALECGRDGMVYVGTAWYGGSAHLIRFNPRTKRWEKIFDAHSFTREPITALDAQGKIHAKILVDAEGIIWAATKHGNESWEERPEYSEDATGYPGGHLFSYNPKTRQTIDHGILMRQNGLMGGAIDNMRRRLFYVSDSKAHFLIYDMDRNTVRDLGYVGNIPRYMAIDRQGRVFIDGGMPTAPSGWLPTGAKTPYLCMYDPETDRLYQLAVIIEGPGENEYMAPYVLVASADGTKLFANAIGGKYLMEFDLYSISLNHENPIANGSIVCRHIEKVTPAGNQRTGVVGKDGCYYFANDRLLFRYNSKQRALVNLGEIADPLFGPNVYPQGAAVAPDGTLYLKHLFPYRLIRFPQLTAPRGSR